MMPLQKRWTEHAARFGGIVRLNAPVHVGSPPFVAPLLLQGFGARRGMVLVATYREIQAITDVLAEAGYGYSCLGDPGDADPDEAAVVEMLVDWGWSGPGQPPSWYGAA